MTTNPTEDKLRGELEHLLRDVNPNYDFELETMDEALTTLIQIVNRERVKAEHRLAVKNAAIQSSLDQKIMILEAKLKSVEEKK